MVNLKKYNAVAQHFVLFLTLLIFASCNQQKYYVKQVEGKQININKSNPETALIEEFIKPYRDSLDKDMNTILAYAPETLEKTKGQWQTNIGNLMADVTLDLSNYIFEKREGKKINICLLNHGGIRAPIPKGNVTTRSAFEVMPFENSAIVIAMKGENIREIADYIIREKKPHPLAGMTFTIDKNNVAKDLRIQGKPVENDLIYYVVTSDYLSNGGDNITFFKKGVQKFDLDYKLRNVLIDYFKEVDTIKAKNDKRIFTEL